MTKEDLNILVWPAMRYALGRMTYVVEMLCGVLIRNAKDIRHDSRIHMAEEIQRAIDTGQAGMDMDVKEWQLVLDEFNKQKPSM